MLLLIVKVCFKRLEDYPCILESFLTTFDIQRNRLQKSVKLTFIRILVLFDCSVYIYDWVYYLNMLEVSGLFDR